MLVDRRFYQKVYGAQIRASYKYGTKFSNSIQTNGTLLSKKWIRFLRQRHFDIGVSYDGPNSNIHRGQSTATISGLELCRKLKYPTGCICVITADTGDFVELYNHQKTLVKSFKISPCMKVGTQDHGIEVQKYIDQLICLFEHWLLDREGIAVKPLTDFVRGVLGTYYCRECTNVGCLGKFIDIDSTGMVRVCAHVSAKSFEMGNLVSYSSISEIFSNANFSNLVKRMIAKRGACKQSCQYYSFCQGGCCVETYLSEQNKQTYSCEVIHGVFPYISARVHEIFEEHDNLGKYNPVFVELVEEAVCKNPIFFLNNCKEGV